MKHNLVDGVSAQSINDISLVFGKVPKTIDDVKLDTFFFCANDNECLFQIPAIAAYYISLGKIIIESKSINEDTRDKIYTFADVYAKPIYLYLKKKIMIGASAVIMKDGKALLLCGDSSCGKSALAWEFCRQGASFVSDEYCEIFENDGRVYVKGGLPYFMLWKNMLKKARFDIKSLKNVYFNSNRNIVHPDNCCSEPVEVEAMISLSASNTECLEIEKLNGADKFKYFFNSIYLHELASLYIGKKDLFSKSVSMANKIEMYKINFNHMGDSLENTAIKVLSELENIKK